MANEVILAPSRLPISPAIAREYDLTPANWRVLVEQIFPAAKSIEAVLMALAYCRLRNLDIFKRPVHIVPMWSTQKRAYVETVWPGIAELRTTAVRTGQYAGNDEIMFGPTVKRKFRGEKDVWDRGQKTGTEAIEREVEFPEWASIVVHRITNGVRYPYHTKIFWRETYATLGSKSEVPNDMWCKRPFGQIDKCVEGAGLRRAFPEELGSTYAAEEMEGRTIEVDDEPAIARPTPPKPPVKAIIEEKKERITPLPQTHAGLTPPTPPKPPAKKAEPKPEPKPAQETYDPETGEVFEGEEQTEAEPVFAGDLLTGLDMALDGATTPEQVEEIWNESDLPAQLESMQGGEQFIGVALGIKRRHAKRVGG